MRRASWLWRLPLALAAMAKLLPQIAESFPMQIAVATD
jgi:hypothetical protein